MYFKSVGDIFTFASLAARSTRGDVEALTKILETCGHAVKAEKLCIGEIQQSGWIRCVASWGGGKKYVPDKKFRLSKKLKDKIKKKKVHMNPTPESDFNFYTEISKKHILMIANKESVGHFDKYKLRDIADLRHLLTEVLVGIKEKNKADRDELTDMYNRKYLEGVIDALEEEDNQTPMSVMMIDADHFKAFNDTFGHDIGDRVLQEIAMVLKKNIRKMDCLKQKNIKLETGLSDHGMHQEGVPARYGGEEFTVILLESVHGATVAADRIRRSIQREVTETILTELKKNPEHKQKLLTLKHFSITTSIGIAQRKPGERLRATRTRADQILYKAKENGRNCVAMIDPEINKLKFFR